MVDLTGQSEDTDSLVDEEEAIGRPTSPNACNDDETMSPSFPTTGPAADGDSLVAFKQQGAMNIQDFDRLYPPTVASASSALQPLARTGGTDLPCATGRLILKNTESGQEATPVIRYPQPDSFNPLIPQGGEGFPLEEQQPSAHEGTMRIPPPKTTIEGGSENGDKFRSKMYFVASGVLLVLSLGVAITAYLSVRPDREDHTTVDRSNAAGQGTDDMAAAPIPETLALSPSTTPTSLAPVTPSPSIPSEGECITEGFALRSAIDDY